MLIWVVILSLFALFFHYLLGNLFNPNQKVVGMINASGQPEVILTRNRAGHYVTNGEINRHDVTFFLDTGATHISIPGKVAKRIGLRGGRSIMVQTANGAIPVQTTTLDSVSIGNIVMTDVKAGINPYMDSEAILLGMNFLKHLELTQRGDTLTLGIP